MGVNTILSLLCKILLLFTAGGQVFLQIVQQLFDKFHLVTDFVVHMINKHLN